MEENSPEVVEKRERLGEDVETEGEGQGQGQRVEEAGQEEGH